MPILVSYDPLRSPFLILSLFIFSLAPLRSNGSIDWGQRSCGTNAPSWSRQAYHSGWCTEASLDHTASTSIESMDRTTQGGGKFRDSDSRKCMYCTIVSIRCRIFWISLTYWRSLFLLKYFVFTEKNVSSERAREQIGYYYILLPQAVTPRYIARQ